MGAGPIALLGERAAAAAVGHEPLAGDEIGRILEVCARVAARASAALAEGRAPLLVTGNCCHACLAAAAALAPRAQRIGVLWFDAHADYDIPETTESSFFDGMALSVLTGAAYARLAARRIPGFAPLDPRRVVMAGVRDLEPYQRERLEASPLRVVAPDALASLPALLDSLAREVDAAYVHVDLDSLDPEFGRANEYAAGGGLSPAGLLDAIDAAFERLPVAAAAVTAYDPACDAEGRMLATGRRVLEQLEARL